jgi:hypothetical protein
MSNIVVSVKNPRKESARTVILVTGSNGSAYFPILTNFTNIYIHDYYGSLFPLGGGGTPMDEINFNNITIQNSVGVSYLMLFVFLKTVRISNFTYQNSIGQEYAIINLMYIHQIEVTQFKLKNITGSLNPVNSLLTFIDFGASKYSLNEITIEDSHFFKSTLWSQASNTEVVTLSNFVISNSTISSGQSLISLASIKHAVIANYTVIGFTTSDTDNDETVMIRINSMDLQSDYDAELYEVRDANNTLEHLH